jgi:hypothetical protein
MTLRPLLDDVIDNIPRHSAVLLSIFAAWELDEEDLDLVGAYSPDGIRQVLQGQLNEAAGQWSLRHLGPWRNY